MKPYYLKSIIMSVTINNRAIIALINNCHRIEVKYLFGDKISCMHS